MADRTLESGVFDELRALRKATHGVTVESLSEATTVRNLLGAGDPYVAYTRLSIEILNSDLGREVRAAAASLGFLAEGDTHLKRLDAFGAEAGLDQRQVRRYSDKGVRILARLISTNWPTESAPQLTIDIRYQDQWELQLIPQQLQVVHMSEPVMQVLTGGRQETRHLGLEYANDSTWRRGWTRQPVVIHDVSEETSVVIVWRGELWPKYNLRWRGASPLTQSEQLGNKCVLRLRGAEGPRVQ